MRRPSGASPTQKSAGPGRGGRELCGAVTALIVLWTATANAQANANVPVGAELLLKARPVEGLLILHSGYRNSPLVEADVLAFMDVTRADVGGDVLSANIGVREPHGYGQLRLGRFILSTGAVRPVQLDGLSILARAPFGSTLEAFAGMPVAPDFGPRAFDWLVGARAAQRLHDTLAFGVSYLQRRDAGMLATEEVGGDVTLRPSAWLNINALAAWDLLTQGLAEARITGYAHSEAIELELFGSRRIAARLLPATSLFSVISDAPSTEAGANANWHAFPRLDLGSTLAFEALEHTAGYRAALRSTLRFSDDGPGEVTVEAVRRDLSDDGYSGAALYLSVPVTDALRPHASVELAAPDHPRGRGELWPWARVGASYAFGGAWLLAAALSARSTPLVSSELSGLVRIAYNGWVQP